MKTLKLNFEDKYLKRKFIDWFLDGGEDEFYNFCDFTDEPGFITDLIFKDKQIEEINFKRDPDDE